MLRLVVFYDNYDTLKFGKDFLIDIQLYCEPTKITTQPFQPNHLSYTIFEAGLIQSFEKPSWVTEPEICNLTYEYKLIYPEPANPDLIKIDDTEPLVKVTIFANSLYFDGNYATGSANAGSYQLEVRAWGDNNFDTEVFELLDIDVLDPCLDL